ncbi:hypothetical protein BH11ACT4_BH11ACT4_09340 [soil metagenome]
MQRMDQEFEGLSIGLEEIEADQMNILVIENDYRAENRQWTP